MGDPFWLFWFYFLFFCFFFTSSFFLTLFDQFRMDSSNFHSLFGVSNYSCKHHHPPPLTVHSLWKLNAQTTQLEKQHLPPDEKRGSSTISPIRPTFGSSPAAAKRNLNNLNQQFRLNFMSHESLSLNCLFKADSLFFYVVWGGVYCCCCCCCVGSARDLSSRNEKKKKAKRIN